MVDGSPDTPELTLDTKFTSEYVMDLVRQLSAPSSDLEFETASAKARTLLSNAENLEIDLSELEAVMSDISGSATARAIDPGFASEIHDQLLLQIPSGLLNDEGRVQKVRVRDFCSNHRTDLNKISSFVDEIEERMVDLVHKGATEWTKEDHDEIDIISETLIEQLPRTLSAIVATTLADRIRRIEKRFRSLVRDSKTARAQKLSEEMAPEAEKPVPTPVMVEEIVDLNDDIDEPIENWARRNKVDNLQHALEIRLAVKDIDAKAAQLAKEYEKAGTDQLEIMKQLFQLTMERISRFPSTESFTFHLGILLGRPDGRLNSMDEQCMQILREEHAKQTRAANEALRTAPLHTDGVSIAPPSDWGSDSTHVDATVVTEAGSTSSDTVVDAPITKISTKAPGESTLPRGVHAPSPSLDNARTRARARETRLKLMSKAQELNNRRAIDKAVREELDRSSKYDSYDRRAWGGIFATAAAGVLAVMTAMGFNQEVDTTVEVENNPSAQSLADADTSPESNTDALTESSPVPSVQVPENSEDLEIQAYSNLWEAAEALHPDDHLVAKNIAVASVANAVDTNASTELALDSLPSGYDEIQKSQCASRTLVGDMLECVGKQFNWDVSDQVAGELVFNGFVTPDSDIDVLATAVETLSNEDAPEQIANATEELQKHQENHPEWFSHSSELATPDGEELEDEDEARASLAPEPVKVNKPSLEQRVKGWWRSAKKKVSSLFV